MPGTHAAMWLQRCGSLRVWGRVVSEAVRKDAQNIRSLRRRAYAFRRASRFGKGGGERMLHFTHRDSVGSGRHPSGLSGEALAWQDVLHDGPVTAGRSLDELRPLRARFLADAFGTDHDTTLPELAEHDF